MRAQGRIQESLALLQAATCLNPQNPANIKQVGRCLFLLGKHKSALEIYEEAQKVHTDGFCLKTWQLLAQDCRDIRAEVQYFTVQKSSAIPSEVYNDTDFISPMLSYLLRTPTWKSSRDQNTSRQKGLCCLNHVFSQPLSFARSWLACRACFAFLKIDADDWEVWHDQGLCFLHLKQFERALEAFGQANSLSRHDSTYLHMGKVGYSCTNDRRTIEYNSRVRLHHVKGVDDGSTSRTVSTQGEKVLYYADWATIVDESLDPCCSVGCHGESLPIANSKR